MSDNNLTVEQPVQEELDNSPKGKKNKETGYDNRDIQSVKAASVQEAHLATIANSLNTPAIQNGATTFVEATKTSATSFQERVKAEAESKGFGIGAPAA